MKIVTASFVLWLAGASLAADPSPQALQLRSFDVPQHGKLVLKLPGAWKYEVRQSPGNLPPSIFLSPQAGDDFKVLITPLWSPKNDPNFNKPENVKRLLQDNLAQMLPSAVEKKVPLKEFQTKDTSGYYFFVTDKAPKPGEYPYAVRAVVGVGDLLLSVTVLCRSKDSPGIAGTIKALGEAEQKKP